MATSIQVEYKKVLPQPLPAHYEIVIVYEHGDADCRTELTVHEEFTHAALVAWVEKFHELAVLIDNSRSTGDTLEHFEDQASPIPVELDCYASRHMSDYYAAMSLKRVTYFDDFGNKYLVNVTIDDRSVV
jgi:hypothetical protein